MKCIKVNNLSKPLRKEKYILCQKSRLNLKSGKEEEIKCHPSFALFSSQFQMNQKLYKCGGVRYKDNKRDQLAQFISFNYSGKSTRLQSMRKERKFFSLSGVNCQLVAIGGQSGVYLNLCEEYNLNQNKWGSLPPLNRARQRAASLVLKSNKIFCFFGYQEYQILSSIETFQPRIQANWRILPFRYKVNQADKLAPVLFRGKIMIFGGKIQKHALSLNEEGELEESNIDSQSLTKISRRQFLVQDGLIYGVQANTTKRGVLQVLVCFDGSHWYPH